MKFTRLFSIATFFISVVFADVDSNTTSSRDLYKRIRADDAAVLFIDHQSGLGSLVQDFSAVEFKNNVLALADISKYFNLPAVLTTSFEDGPNGPIFSELKETFPNASFIPRPGQINAWDNADFVNAVKATGRKQLLISGIVTDVCVAFAALSAINEGYEVFVVTDASGTFNEVTRYAAWDRMSRAGIQLVNWFAVAGELLRDWRNDPAGSLSNLASKHLPMSSYLIQSRKAAEDFGKKGGNSP
ncbi:uncharacterized protein VTP21DRAFT_3231 [Calcarisporiella thermophila]|uniref:uncharacterized protein n=1 Tax=Calcarisporiella thermophila TaxID=911321 RepID=UPI0037423C52